MRIQSTMAKPKYLSELKSRMDRHFELGVERCTGFFLGSLICVTYHSGWEWNRRIRNQKNTALGIVRNTETGCEVRYINLKGLLAPQYLLGLLVFLVLSCLLLSMGTNLLPYLLPTSIGLGILIALLDAWLESLTRLSQNGAKALQEILASPKAKDKLV